jgi:Helix-turn-helix
MKPEIEHMLTVLKTVMRILGYSNRDIERQLGFSSSYLSRLFAGILELRFEHIVDISRAMGLKPEEVLRFAYPPRDEPPSEAALRLQEVTGSYRAAVPAAPAPVRVPSEEDLERLVTKTMRKVFGELAGPPRP